MIHLALWLISFTVVICFALLLLPLLFSKLFWMIVSFICGIAILGLTLLSWSIVTPTLAFFLLISGGLLTWLPTRRLT